jgi:hypothetical protein
MSSNATILIHGDEWKLVDLELSVKQCREIDWNHERWRPRPALVNPNGGTVSLYRGQKYDPTKVDLVPDGWNHDHCEICCWTLHESDDEQHAIGYTNGRGSWLCSECYDLFLRGDKIEDDRTLPS